MKISVFWIVTLFFYMNMETAGCSETLIPISQTTCWYIQKTAILGRFVCLLWHFSLWRSTFDLNIFVIYTGHNVYGALVIIKQFATHRCGHNDKPVPGSVCLESMLGVNNPNRYAYKMVLMCKNCWKWSKILRTLHYFRYIIATQDKELQAVARRIPGTPLLYLHQKAPTLEQPSAASSRMARINSNEKLVKIFKHVH